MAEIILIIVVFWVIIFGVRVYNQLSALREAVINSDKTFEATLLRKNSLAQEVIEIAQQVAIYDQNTYKAIAHATHDAAKEMAKSSHPSIILTDLSVHFPQLRHEESFRAAQQMAAAIEGQIDSALIQRNRLAEQFNIAVISFPEVIVAKFLGFDKIDFRDDGINDSNKKKGERISRQQVGSREEIERNLDILLRRNQK
ncbi:LemA family protein [Nitrosomonas oligotropha]|uniref:Uncharacterized conserved protein n=1 Tax=Nitrosomonas oligotropha TaxID=42354 RepID=A0A1H8R7V2_9PROT|nr:LemA family protein [Nitrosomonas oligotropha]SDW83931.1 Uncharacterized conserved protein [Nitrosomonas oligotropha]SEO62377.1 Uncharacterized conserved protein [Nitrosomonas oligotropha]